MKKTLPALQVNAASSGFHYKNYRKVVLQAMPGKLTCKSKFAQ